jgi:hypothetical protein
MSCRPDVLPVLHHVYVGGPTRRQRTVSVSHSPTQPTSPHHSLSPEPSIRSRIGIGSSKREIGTDTESRKKERELKSIRSNQEQELLDQEGGKPRPRGIKLGIKIHPFSWLPEILLLLFSGKDLRMRRLVLSIVIWICAFSAW